MAYLTIHHLPGDPDDLAARKRERFDPVINPLAHKHGATLSVTASVASGLLIVNVWDSAQGATALQQEPDAIQARDLAMLPPPDRFEVYENVQVDDFR